MRYALNIDKETNRILSATFEQFATERMPIVDELPDGDITDYVYENGKCIYKEDEEKKRQEKMNAIKAEVASCRERLRELDYIGTKIATGRATKEEYAEQIAEMTALADRINELENKYV